MKGVVLYCKAPWGRASATTSYLTSSLALFLCRFFGGRLFACFFLGRFFCCFLFGRLLFRGFLCRSFLCRLLGRFLFCFGLATAAAWSGWRGPGLGGWWGRGNRHGFRLAACRSGHARFRDWHHQFDGRPPRLPSKPRASAPPPSAVASERLATPAPARYPIYTHSALPPPIRHPT